MIFDVANVDQWLTQIKDKASLKVWREFLVQNLAKLNPKESPLEVLGVDFSQKAPNSTASIPDYIYSTAINELVAKDYLEEAYTLVIKVLPALLGPPRRPPSRHWDLRKSHAPHVRAEVRRQLPSLPVPDDGLLVRP
jgi:hypothetical protein